MVPADHHIPKTQEPHQPSLLLEAESDEHDEKKAKKSISVHAIKSPELRVTHPENQQIALSTVSGNQPYLVFSPVEKRTRKNPLHPVAHMFSTWSRKAETIAGNIWNNLKTGPSVFEAAWGKVSLRAKAITEGGFEGLFKQMFVTDPWEKLTKRFACYLSTTAGPVAGTLYLSTARVAFCSDLPLSFTTPSGEETAWSYYKVVIPWRKIRKIQQLTVGADENSQQKYIQIITVDKYQFWFMGFVNFEKASHHLLSSRSDVRF